MDNNKNLLIVDTAFLICRTYYSGGRMGQLIDILNTAIWHGRHSYSDVGIDIVFAMESNSNWRDKYHLWYKKNRAEKSDELKTYIEELDWFLKAEYPEALFIRKEGFEGDDIMGIVAHNNKAKYRDVYIMTADKDLYQFLDENVSILSVGKHGSTEYRTWNFNKEFEGLTTEQYVLYKALKGDSSDGYLGLPNIGNKRAIYCAKKYNLEQILDIILSGKVTKLGMKEDLDTSNKLIKAMYLTVIQNYIIAKIPTSFNMDNVISDNNLRLYNIGQNME